MTIENLSGFEIGIIMNLYFSMRFISQSYDCYDVKLGIINYTCDDKGMN